MTEAFRQIRRGGARHGRRSCFVLAAVAAGLFGSAGGLHAQDDPATGKAEAEHAIQAYLAMWSRDSDINAASVARFYAPHVIYFGKSMSRAQVLADKRAYIRQWPVRHYTEVPGSFRARCNAGRGLCEVTAVMMWRRVSRLDRVSTGRARLKFDFVPADGARKIARESAQIL